MQMPFGDSTTGTTPDTTGTSSWLTDASNLLSQGLSLYGQLQLQNLNMNLIKQGKPPLTAAQTAAMAPQLNVGLSPDVKTAVFNYSLVFGIAGIGLVMLMANKRRRR